MQKGAFRACIAKYRSSLINAFALFGYVRQKIKKIKYMSSLINALLCTCKYRISVRSRMHQRVSNNVAISLADQLAYMYARRCLGRTTAYCTRRYGHSAQTMYPHWLIMVFVHLKTFWMLSYPQSALRRLFRSIDMQAEISPRWAHIAIL